MPITLPKGAFYGSRTPHFERPKNTKRPIVRDFVEPDFGTFSKMTFYKIKSGQKHLNNHPVTSYGPYNLAQYDFFVFAIHMNLTITTLKSHFLVVNNFDLQIIFLKKPVTQLC